MEASWQPTIIGHRGARGLAPENTLPAFRLAAEMNLAAAELDVHLTSDGEVVVVHDHDVDRTTDGTGRVEEMSFAELRTLNAAARWADTFPATPIPTLDEVLEEFGRRFEWEIEVKVDDRTDVPGVVSATSQVIAAHGLRDRIILTSFSPDALRTARDLVPDYRRGLITAERPLEVAEEARELGCVRVCVNQSVLEPDIADTIRASGLTITGWQGNSPEELVRLHAARVHAFSSDRPDIALAWMRENRIQPRLHV